MGSSLAQQLRVQLLEAVVVLAEYLQAHDTAD